ncbi:MAG: NADH-quinone oxidoreductase subunit NuoK [Deltaproteobacteria bacterium]|nr:NADH-quinone oxidoreductase subunit NuoK [Deltaproteobacteria bacterium]MCL5792141.1 NADH-quinone oxidoreductase subunit NuoK [Deltaproteobacteria bacterium]
MSYQMLVILSFILFVIGMIGVAMRRNIIIMLVSLELMLNAVNILFVSVSKYLHTLDGQIFVIMVITIAAAETAIALALLVRIYKTSGMLKIDDLKQLKW